MLWCDYFVFDIADFPFFDCDIPKQPFLKRAQYSDTLVGHLTVLKEATLIIVKVFSSPEHL